MRLILRQLQCRNSVGNINVNFGNNYLQLLHNWSGIIYKTSERTIHNTLTRTMARSVYIIFTLLTQFKTKLVFMNRICSRVQNSTDAYTVCWTQCSCTQGTKPLQLNQSYSMSESVCAEFPPATSLLPPNSSTKCLYSKPSEDALGLNENQL